MSKHSVEPLKMRFLDNRDQFGDRGRRERVNDSGSTKDEASVRIEGVLGHSRKSRQFNRSAEARL